MSNQLELDLYLLATQGQFSEINDKYRFAFGYHIIVDEQIVDIPISFPGITTGKKYETEKRKLIKLRLYDKLNNLFFEKDLLLKNINLKVSDIKFDQENNLIKVTVDDCKISNFKREIIVNVNVP